MLPRWKPFAPATPEAPIDSMAARLWRKARVASISIIGTVFFGFAGVELLGQIWFNNPYYYWEERYLYITPDSIRNVEDFSTYVPGAALEEVGIYRSSTGRFFEEFRCRYQVDELGFLDNPPSADRHYDILLLGDSFTQGQAGCSWVDKLRARLPTLKIYNAGINGTNFQHWAVTKDYLERHGYSFDKALVIFISDDFYRHFTQWTEAPLQCLHDVGRCTTQFIYPLKPDLDLIAMSRKRALLRDTSRLRGRVIYFWKRNLWVSYFLYENLERLLGSRSPLPAIAPEMTAALSRILTTSKAVRLVRVLQKDETALQADNAESIAAGDYLKEHRIDFDTCDVGYDNYFPYDGHPTSRGYDRLAECLSKIIGPSAK
jgi:hypothetical protein